MSPIQGDVSDSPSTTPAPCEDTSLSFQVSNGVFETCAYVGENVQERCTRKVQLACPKTCLACDTCADFSSKFQFQKRGVTKTSKCEKKANEKTCKRIDGLAELCRESCGLCPA